MSTDGAATLERPRGLDARYYTEEQSRLIAEDWDNTAWEDFVIVESVQRGMSSRGYRPGPLILDPSGTCDVHSENSVHHLQGLLLASPGDTA